MIAKLPQVEDKKVVCGATVFSLFLFLKFILFCLGEYFVNVCAKAARIAYGIINKRDEVGQFIYWHWLNFSLDEVLTIIWEVKLRILW